MSAHWINEYASLIAKRIIDVVATVAASAVASLTTPMLAEFIEKGIRNADFELWLLRAKTANDKQWTLRGFQLLSTVDDGGALDFRRPKQMPDSGHDLDAVTEVVRQLPPI